MTQQRARLMAGSPATNKSLYREVQFLVHDPVVFVELPDGSRTMILREIELERAAAAANVDTVAGYGEFAPIGGLDSDRGVLVGQVAAECLTRAGVERVTADRSLPLQVTREVEGAGIAVELDSDMGVADRRSKSDQELSHLRCAQQVTEAAMQLACQTVARASAGPDGVLVHGGDPLTAQRVRAIIDTFLLGEGFHNPESIVAGGATGADCHDTGSGPLRSGEPVIIDIFPQDRATLYNGDCTRTVVHGDVPPPLAAMHAAVVEAKAAATAAVAPGVSGAAVHAETIRVLSEHGYAEALAAGDETATITHGTGHGIGLDVHEAPLLAAGGPDLVAGDVLTIEPGLYSRALGGVRVEDMVVVTEDGCESFNELPEGLDWS